MNNNFFVKHLFFISIISLTTFLLYFHVSGFGVSIDDLTYFFKNTYINSGWSNIWSAFIPGNVITAIYTPLTFIFSFLLFKFWGVNPSPYHLFYLFVYILTCIILYFFYYLHFKSSVKGFLGGLIFAVLPLHTEVVAWISAGGYLYSMLFISLFLVVLMVLLNKFDGMTKSARVLFFLSLYLLHICAMLSQPTAILLPCLMLIYVCFFAKKHLLYFAKASLPMIIFSVVFVCFSLIAITSSRFQVANPLPFASKMALAGKSIISLFVFYDYSTMYPFPEYYNPSLTFIVFSVILLFLMTFLYIRLKYRTYRFFVVWFLSSYSIYSQFFFNSNTPTAERYLYLASIASVLLFVDFINKLYKKIISSKLRCGNGIIVSIFILIFSYYSASSYFYSFVWRDEYSTILYAYNNYPQAHNFNFTLGMKKAQIGELSEAVKLFRKTIDIFPEHQDVYYYLAKALQDLGRYSESIQPALTLEKLVGSYYRIDLLILKGYYYSQGYPEAERRLRKMISLSSKEWFNDPVFCYVGLKTLIASGELDDALKFFKGFSGCKFYKQDVFDLLQTGLSGRAFNYKAYYNKLADSEDADYILPEIIRVFRIREKHGKNGGEVLKSSSSLVDLASEAAMDNDFDRAEKLLLKSIALDPYNVDAFVLLSQVYLRQNKAESAMKMAEKGYSLNPSSLEIKSIIQKVSR